MRERPVFLVTEPSHFDVRYQINPWMRPDAWASDPMGRRDAAIKASCELVDALSLAGARVEAIPGVDGLPDLVFPANAAIVLDGKALLARFRFPERQGEEAVFASTFALLKARGLIDEVAALPDGVLQEGAGDAIWDADREFFWVGYGQRSTESSVTVVERVFRQDVVPLKLASERFYHLDTCFCPLSGGKVLYYPPAFTPVALRSIHAHVEPGDRIEATDADANAFCVNAVNVGTHIIMAKAPRTLRRRLEREGFSLSEIDLTPFILSGGGAYCMTLRLDRVTEPARVIAPAE
jgi:N-dimethylarginine dimethylaminohydrolase